MHANVTHMPNKVNVDQDNMSSHYQTYILCQNYMNDTLHAARLTMWLVAVILSLQGNRGCSGTEHPRGA